MGGCEKQPKIIYCKKKKRKSKNALFFWELEGMFPLFPMSEGCARVCVCVCGFVSLNCAHVCGRGCGVFFACSLQVVSKTKYENYFYPWVRPFSLPVSGLHMAENLIG